MERIPITLKGFKILCEKIVKLKEVERPKIIETIKTARSFGDLKENTEYLAAIDEQLFLEKRIEVFEGKIRNAFIIDIKKFVNDGRVVFGSSVVLEDMYSLRKIKYKIIGIDEVDILIGSISINSPIAKSLINRFKGEIIHLRVPKGLVVFKIFDVVYE